jgi:sugar phosphate isomerase/epimerase
MTVCSIGSPFGKCELEDAAEVAKHMDLLRRCADIGHELGCGLVRGFVFWGHGRREKPWDAMLRAYEPVPAILEEKDIVLGVENEYACYVGTAGHVREFADRLGCARAKIVWDPANHVHDPEGTNVPAYPDGYQCVRGDIVHVHMKDAAPKPDGSVADCFLGSGRVDWPGQFQALKDDGYTGFASLETHVDPKDLPADMRARYGQYITSEDREGASRVSLAWVRDVVAELR